MFSCFDGILTSDRQTDKQADRQTDTESHHKLCDHSVVQQK